jgi:hypothetical protein
LKADVSEGGKGWSANRIIEVLTAFQEMIDGLAAYTMRLKLHRTRSANSNNGKRTSPRPPDAISGFQSARKTH